MGKITLDISEWKQMEKNAELLEASLENEKKNKEEIERLQKEKIDSLKESSKRVVKIHKKQGLPTIKIKRSSFTTLEDVRNIMGYGDFGFRSSEGILLDLLEHCFDIEQIETEPIESITTHGLDEIHLEIEEKLKAELDSSIKKKLNEAEKFVSEKSQLTKGVEELKKDLNNKNKMLTEVYDSLDKIKKQREEESKESRNSILCLLREIEIIAKKNKGFLNGRKAMSEIIKLCNRDYLQI